MRRLMGRKVSAAETNLRASDEHKALRERPRHRPRIRGQRHLPVIIINGRSKQYTGMTCLLCIIAYVMTTIILNNSGEVLGEAKQLFPESRGCPRLPSAAREAYRSDSVLVMKRPIVRRVRCRSEAPRRPSRMTAVVGAAG